MTDKIKRILRASAGETGSVDIAAKHEMEKHRSSISRIILDLEREGFVKCINPEDDRFRYYVKK